MKKLEREALLPYIHNSLRTEIDENGLVRFYRFTDRQLREYDKSEKFPVRAALNSGIKLEFYTDSLTLELSWELLQQAPWLNKSMVELYVNGDLEKQWDFQGDPDKSVCIAASLPAGMKRIEFWLNHNLDVALCAMSVDENAVLQVVPEKKKYLALGDSITYSSALRPSRGYAMQVAQHFGWELHNQGVGGYYYDADSLDPDIMEKPDVITVAYGTNDRRDDRQAYQQRVGKYLERLVFLWPDVPVFVIMPLWRMDISGTDAFDWIYPCIQAECEKYPQITVIDGRNAMPHVGELYTDGLHPNDEGMTYYANYVIQAIKASKRLDI